MIRWLGVLAWLASNITVPTWAQTSATWSTVGPAGGSVTALAKDPGLANTLYVGSDANGVFQSTDGGATWRAANTGLPVHPVTGHRRVYAMATIGNFLYAALEGGVYVAPAGGPLTWSALPLPGNAAPVCDYNYLVAAGSTLYMSSGCQSSVYFTTVAGAAPSWSNSALPAGNLVTGLGLLADDIAVGATAAVFLPDRSGAGLVWIDSEAGVSARVIAGNVTSLTAASSSATFACTLDGQLFQGAMAASNGPIAWTMLAFAGAAAPSSCNGLAVVRVSAAPQWVLVMATDSGAFVSTVFDNTSTPPVAMVPGPTFPLTTYVNAALQPDPANSSALVWATEYGLYSSSAASLTVLNMAAPTALNGPAALAVPSQRLDNVNVKDVAAVGASLFSIVESNGRPSYGDVVRSTDGGANWTRTGLTTRFPAITRIRALAPDVARAAVYAATDQGVYGYELGKGFWELVGNVYDVKALAVGAQALYAGRDASASPSGGLVVQRLLGGTSFTAVENMPTLPSDFNVRALVVSAGRVYVAGGVLIDADALTYANAVYSAADFVPGPAVPVWSVFGSGAFSAVDLPVLSRLAVGNGQVFVGGQGFLRQSASAATPWSDVPGLPTRVSGGLEGVTALASDGTALFVGTAGRGVFAKRLDSNSALVPVNGRGDTALASLVVNGLRVIDGRLYVSGAAGLGSANVSLDTAPSPGSGGGGGGGCSVAMGGGEPDPLLWVMVGLALVQIGLSRRRIARPRQSTVDRP